MVSLYSLKRLSCCAKFQKKEKKHDGIKETPLDRLGYGSGLDFLMKEGLVRFLVKVVNKEDYKRNHAISHLVTLQHLTQEHWKASVWHKAVLSNFEE